MDKALTEVTMNERRVQSPQGHHSVVLTFAGSVPFGADFFSLRATGFEPPWSASALVGEAVWTPDGSRLVVTIFHEVSPSRAPDVELVVATLTEDGIAGHTLARVDRVPVIDEVSNDAVFVWLRGAREEYRFPSKC